MTKKSVKKLILGLKIISLVLLLAFALTELYRLYYQYDFNNKMWLKEDNPSGNPLKVQKKDIVAGKKNSDKKENILYKFKYDLEDFYRGK